MEKTGTKEQFADLGKKCGVVPKEFLELIVAHVWQGGSPQDLKWVEEALDQMGLRRDLRVRWWHSWRSFLGLPIPKDEDPIVIQRIIVKKPARLGKCRLMEVDGHIEADCDSSEAAQQLQKLLKEEVIIRVTPQGTLLFPLNTQY